VPEVCLCHGEWALGPAREVLNSTLSLCDLRLVHRVGRQRKVPDKSLGLEGVNCVRSLGESEAPKVAMEIPCAWCVVTQKRETVLFGAEDGGGWSPGADACPGGAV
jgi:hypothetical protein